MGSDFRDLWVGKILSVAFWADQFRTSSRFDGWERVDNDVFDPVDVVTGTATIAVPSGRSLERDLFLSSLLNIAAVVGVLHR